MLPQVSFFFYILNTTHAVAANRISSRIEIKKLEEVDLKKITTQDKTDISKTLNPVKSQPLDPVKSQLLNPVKSLPLDPVEQYLATMDTSGHEVFKLRAMPIPRSERVYKIEWLLDFQGYNMVPRPFIFIPPGKLFNVHKTLKLAHKAKARGRTLDQAIEAEKLGKITLPETPDSLREGRRYEVPDSPLKSPLGARGKPKALDYSEEEVLPIIQNPSGTIKDELIPEIQADCNNEQPNVTDSNAHESGAVENLVNIRISQASHDMDRFSLAFRSLVEAMEEMEKVVTQMQETVRDAASLSNSRDIEKK